MNEQGDDKKRSRLYRCDTEEQRDRLVQEKYGGRDQIMILNIKRYDGKTFPECMLDEIHSIHMTVEYYQTKLWADIHNDSRLDYCGGLKCSRIAPPILPARSWIPP